jgi:hypothetical protein
MIGASLPSLPKTGRAPIQAFYNIQTSCRRSSHPNSSKMLTRTSGALRPQENTNCSTHVSVVWDCCCTPRGISCTNAHVKSDHPVDGCVTHLHPITKWVANLSSHQRRIFRTRDFGNSRKLIFAVELIYLYWSCRVATLTSIFDPWKMFNN